MRGQISIRRRAKPRKIPSYDCRPGKKGRPRWEDWNCGKWSARWRERREGINDGEAKRVLREDSVPGLAATLIPREYARPQTRADPLPSRRPFAFHSLPFRRGARIAVTIDEDRWIAKETMDNATPGQVRNGEKIVPGKMARSRLSL